MTVPPAPDTRIPSGVCPACGAATAGGRFCSACGALLAGTACPACHAPAAAGARFCNQCGAALGAASPAMRGMGANRSMLLPWGAAALAIVALGGLVVGRNLGVALARDGRGEAATLSTPAAETDAGGASAGGDAADAAAAPMAGGGPGGGAGAPDISAMSPRERADRLYDRVMRLGDEGKRDSVDFFLPMVLSAYQNAGAARRRRALRRRAYR